MKNCRYCGALLEDTACFCTGCGQQTAQPQQPGSCKGCGQPLLEGYLFCTRCGKRVGTQTSDAAKKPETAPQPLQEPPVLRQPEKPVAERPVAEQPKEVPVQPVPEQPWMQYGQPAYSVQGQPSGPYMQPGYPMAPQQPFGSQKAKKRIWPWIIGGAALLLLLGIFFLTGGFVRRVKYPVPPTEEALADFWETVMKNADGDYVIADSYFRDIESGSGSRLISAEIVLAPDTNGPADDSRVWGRMYTSGFTKKGEEDSCVYRITATLPGRSVLVIPVRRDYKTIYDMLKDMVIALERTLTGKTKAAEYLLPYAEMHELAKEAGEKAEKQGGNWRTDVTRYWLTDKIEVEIDIAGTEDTQEWNMCYTLYIHP